MRIARLLPKMRAISFWQSDPSCTVVLSRTGSLSVKQPVLKLLPRTLNIAIYLKQNLLKSRHVRDTALKMHAWPSSIGEVWVLRPRDAHIFMCAFYRSCPEYEPLTDLLQSGKSGTMTPPIRASRAGQLSQLGSRGKYLETVPSVSNRT